jgi:two-component system response regulator FixJ
MANVVTIIDDDDFVLDALSVLLRTKGYGVAAYTRAADFLRAPFAPGCIVTDVRMPELTGLELLHRLKSTKDMRPVILLTAHGDVEMAMRAVKIGAFDFIEKPFQEDRLLEAVKSALELFDQCMAEHNETALLCARFDSLTQRQRETMELLVQGYANKDIAARLGISPRTVEIYRAWVMSKMGARSLAELVHMSIRMQGVLPKPAEAEPGERPA